MSSSNSYASSSSHAASMPTSSSQPATQNDNRAATVGIVLGILGAIIVAGIIYTTIRMKRRQSIIDAETGGSYTSRSHGTALDRSHLAARITPFGSPGGETPRFKHTPGTDMRIATRRPDGAWHFTDPRSPFTPSGVSDIDVVPSPASSTVRLLPKSRTKEQEAKRLGDYRYEYDRDYEHEINPPPPAYGGHDYGYGGYLPHAKS